MTYSIIGSGTIGVALARQFGQAGLTVTIAAMRARAERVRCGD